MAKFLSIFLVVLFCQIFVFASSALNADTFKLNSISIEGNNRLSDAAISNYTKIDISKILSPQDLNQSYKNLINTGLFKTVNFEKSNSNLKITVEEYPTVNEISFEGNTKFSDKRLLSLLTIKPRFVLTPSILDKDLNSIELNYKNSGRISARISPKVIRLSDNRVNVVFEIYEGSTVEVESISFVGNRSFSDRRLRRVLETKQAGLLRKLILRDTLISERITLDKRLLKDFYLSRGYADFEVLDVNAELSKKKMHFSFHII